MHVDHDVPLRTLLVDASHNDAAVVTRMLRMAGAPAFDVIHVADLDMAEAVLRKRRADLILLGVADDGLASLARLGPRVRTTPVAVLTPDPWGADMQQAAADSGAVACIFKGEMKPATLHRILHDAVRRTYEFSTGRASA